MEQLIDFIGNHTMMVVAWVMTLGMLLFTENLKSGKSVSAAEATRMINKENAVVLDIRATKDFSAGHVANSINIPLADFDRRMSELNQYKDKPVLGNRRRRCRRRRRLLEVQVDIQARKL